LAVYGYVRVSTDRQADEGESLGAQQRRLEGAAAMLGSPDIDAMFVERGVSGGVPLGERPEGARLLARAEKGDIIVSPKLDRLFRSAIDALSVLDALKKRGIRLYLLDFGEVTNGNGELVFGILSAVVQWERRMIQMRVAEVKKDQRRRHRYLGGIVPFGWQVGEGGELVEDPAQQAAIRRMQALRAEGKSLRAIAAAMAAEGMKISHEGAKQVLSAQDRAAA
jgi:putative DNA-invertase from lambdoid prophage Rac